LRLGVPAHGWRALLEKLGREAEQGEGAKTEDWARAIVRFAPAIADMVEPLAQALRIDLAPEHGAHVDQILREVLRTPAFAVADHALGKGPDGPARLAPEVVAVLALVLAPESAIDGLGPALAAEVTALRRQLGALCAPRG